MTSTSRKVNGYLRAREKYLKLLGKVTDAKIEMDKRKYRLTGTQIAEAERRLREGV